MVTKRTAEAASSVSTNAENLSRTRRIMSNQELAENRPDAVRHRFPEIELLMVFMQIAEGCIGGRGQRDTGLGEYEVEIGPAALLVVGALNRLSLVEALLRARLRGGERGGGRVDAVARERLADPRPVRVDEDAAGVEEHGLNRHGFSLHLSEA